LAPDDKQTPPSLEMQQPPPEEGVPQETDRPDMSAEERQVENVAIRMRKAYFRKHDERTLKTKGRTSNRLTDNADKWRALAKILVAQPLCNPEAFIASHYTSTAMPLLRDMLKNPAIQEYLAFCREAEEGYKARWESGMGTLDTAVLLARQQWPDDDPETLQREAVLDLNVKMSSLFRYCWAHAKGWHDVAKRFKAVAMDELLVDPEGFKRVWQDHLPTALLEELDAQINKVQ